MYPCSFVEELKLDNIWHFWLNHNEHRTGVTRQSQPTLKWKEHKHQTDVHMAVCWRAGDPFMIKPSASRPARWPHGHHLQEERSRRSACALRGRWGAALALVTRQTQEKTDKRRPSYLTSACTNTAWTSGARLVHDPGCVSGGLSLSSAGGLCCKSHWGKKMCCLRHHCGPKHRHVTFVGVTLAC